MQAHIWATRNRIHTLFGNKYEMILTLPPDLLGCKDTLFGQKYENIHVTPWKNESLASDVTIFGQREIKCLHNPLER